MANVNNSESDTLVSGTSRVDSITNDGDNVTIAAGSGNDSIYNTGEYSSIAAGPGADYIEDEGYASTINGDSGNDDIYNYGNYAEINGGDGDDYIYSSNSDYSGAYVTINGGAGNDIIEGLFGDSSVFGGAGADIVSMSGDVDNATISGGTGNDTVYMDNADGINVYQYTEGDGNDIIFYFNGNDTLRIGDGTGTCSIFESGDDFIVTIGDGSITLAGVASLSSSLNIDGDFYYEDEEEEPYEDEGELYSYSSGDSNDTIYGFSEIDTLEIGGGGWYTSQTSGSDIIVDIWEDGYVSCTITLVGAASLSTVNIDGYYYDEEEEEEPDEPPYITGTTGNDQLSNSEYEATIEGYAGNDTISNDGGDSFIYGGEGNDSIVNDGDNSFIDGGDDNDYIENWGKYAEIYGGNGDDSIYSSNNSHWGAYVTIDGGNGNDTIVGQFGDSSVFGGAGADIVSMSGDVDNATISGGTGNDTVYMDNADGINVYQYTEGDGNDIIFYFNANDTLRIGDGTDSYSTVASGNDIIITVGDGKITLIGAASLSTVHIEGTLIETNSWTISGTTAKYGDLVTVTGVKDTVGLSISGKVITVGADSLNFAKVTVSDGYTLRLADDVNKSTNQNAWSHSNTTATYNQTKSPGYSLASDSKSISYSKRSTTTLATVTGVKNANGLSISGKVITVGAASLDFKKVTVSDGYTLKLGSDVNKSTNQNAWSHSNTTATYNQTKSPGYLLASDSKSISYSKRTTTTLATVTGVQNAEGLSVDGKVITVGAASLDFKKVTVSDGYTLRLADDVNKSSSRNVWSHSDTTATYNQTKSPGYSLASDSKSISYSKRSTTTLATVTGVKDTAGLSISGKVITVGAASLDFKKVTVSDGYTLKLGDDVSKSTSQNVWNHSGTTATYDQTKSPGYSLASDSKSISYSKRSTTTLATVTGAKNKDALSVSGNKITLNNSSLNNKVTIGGGYEFDFAADYGNATIMGSSKADTITARGNNVSVHGGKGDDTIKMLGSAQTIDGGSGKDVFVYESGQGVIVNYAAEDKISIASGTAATSKSGNDLILTVGNGKISVTGGANQTVTYFDANGEHVYKKTTDDVSFSNEGKTATLKDIYEAYSFNVADFSTYQNKVVTIDGSAVSHSLEIVGNGNSNVINGTASKDTIDGGAGGDKLYGKNGNDSLFGGADNDSLWGGNGSDTLWGGDDDDWLQGGVGNDLFVYSSGHDVISDYEQGLDKIMILSGEVPGLVSTNLSDNLTFKVGTKGSIVVENGSSKTIEFVNSKGEYLHTHFPSTAR